MQTAAAPVTEIPAPAPASGEAPAFEDRQLLVKRSASEGPDSDGMAVDLGASLDGASPSGVFMCLADPCEAVLPIAPEPDLSAAAGQLGDWLTDPDALSPEWESLADVLAGRAPGAEIAVVYRFDVDSAGWTDVELRASAGSGLFVWLDGAYVFGAGADDGFVDDLTFEYEIALPDLSGGLHFLQVLAESHVPDPGYALELRGTPVGQATRSVVAVSEPGTLALFALGLVALTVVLRRRRR